ncbi:hypothetical protein JN11_03294 [Mucilaginibacter frigoritolerans]|uniref:Uncharacterized protein n=1 Tax=Mucilaginibacter frigoritolerans TaxID=652788 RepID=A0A562TXB2_9SPHI|nr:hypothetical protein [Mucilaginibacter frigoritolerans]TWI98215.1 hypothetical protein JN11_03294 [Mucilaginibacter frigoritolerans]
MQLYKTAKIYFSLAVLLLVAKPFLGFGMFSRIHPPADENIFVKAFNKRKQEYSEDSNNDFNTLLKKLAEPAKLFFLRFLYFLNILFPAVFAAGISITTGLLNKIRSDLSDGKQVWLLNSTLLI